MASLPPVPPPVPPAVPAPVPSPARPPAIRTTVAHHLAWKALLRAHSRVTTAVARSLQAAGVLPLEGYDVLISLAQAPEGRLRLAELAEDVLLSKSGLTRSVDRLEDAGLLRREGCETDGRVWYAVLTKKGRAALDKAWPVYRERIDAFVGDRMSEEEAEKLRDLLDRISAAAEPPRPLGSVQRNPRKSK